MPVGLSVSDGRHAVVTAGGADRARIAAMLARAFAGDPAMCFIFPDPVDRARRLPRLFALLFDADGGAGLRLMTQGGEAATLWRAPGRAQVGRWEMLRSTLPMLHALGAALPRALRVAEAADAHHPAGGFWYLHIAGCDPAYQRRGLGAAAVCAGIDRVARRRLPVCLETPLERNIGFYRTLGFAVTGEWQVPRGGPRFWSMQRAP